MEMRQSDLWVKEQSNFWNTDKCSSTFLNHLLKIMYATDANWEKCNKSVRLAVFQKGYLNQIAEKIHGTSLICQSAIQYVCCEIYLNSKLVFFYDFGFPKNKVQKYRAITRRKNEKSLFLDVLTIYKLEENE